MFTNGDKADNIFVLNVFGDTEVWDQEWSRTSTLAALNEDSPNDSRSTEYIQRMNEYRNQADILASRIDPTLIISIGVVSGIEALVYEGRDAYGSIDDAFDYLFPMYDEQLDLARHILYCNI
jgi:hypothetical protein